MVTKRTKSPNPIPMERDRPARYKGDLRGQAFSPYTAPHGKPQGIDISMPRLSRPHDNGVSSAHLSLRCWPHQSGRLPYWPCLRGPLPSSQALRWLDPQGLVQWRHYSAPIAKSVDDKSRLHSQPAGIRRRVRRAVIVACL
jgi:hypothetical protein